MKIAKTCSFSFPSVGSCQLLKVFQMKRSLALFVPIMLPTISFKIVESTISSKLSTTRPPMAFQPSKVHSLYTLKTNHHYTCKQTKKWSFRTWLFAPKQVNIYPKKDQFSPLSSIIMRCVFVFFFKSTNLPKYPW